MILFFGNIPAKHGANPTFIEQLAPKIRELETIIVASDHKNSIIRMIHMIGVLLVNFRNAKLVLIDTYSTKAFYYTLIISILSRFFSVPYISILHGGNLTYRLKKSPFFSSTFFRYRVTARNTQSKTDMNPLLKHTGVY